MPVGAQVAHQVGDPLPGFGEGSDISDLGADMNADARNFEIRRCGSPGVESARTGDGYSELVLMQTGRDVGMGIGGHIRIHAKSDPRSLPKPRGTFCQSEEFGFALDIEE